MLLSQTAGAGQAVGKGGGLDINKTMALQMMKGIIAGDVMNALMYRIRPYELNEGTTDRAIEECKSIVRDALIRKRSIYRAMWKCRGVLKKIKVDRSRVKPKVSIIGEFWAMTTEGDGNYKLQRFLESEGAEVDIQLLTAWLLFTIWEKKWDTKQRALLRGADGHRKGLKGKNIQKTLIGVWMADKLLRFFFRTFAWTMGLSRYKMPDI